jgi:hypothetical protein
VLARTGGPSQRPSVPAIVERGAAPGATVRAMPPTAFETDVHFRVLEAFREEGIAPPALLTRRA